MSFWNAVPLDVSAEFGSAVSSSGSSLRWFSVVVAAATGTALMLVWLQSAALARLSPTNVITDSQYPLKFRLPNACTCTTRSRADVGMIREGMKCGRRYPERQI
jgi:hypothetical protein